MCFNECDSTGQNAWDDRTRVDSYFLTLFVTFLVETTHQSRTDVLERSWSLQPRRNGDIPPRVLFRILVEGHGFFWEGPLE